MKIALLTTDNREHRREYEKETPYFGTAPEALLQGFAGLPEVEIHVVTCTQRVMKSPVKLAEKIFFYSLHVPKIGWMRTGYQGCIRATRRKLQEIKPDIVHGQGTERDCAISAVFSGYPNVLTIHGNMRLIAQVTHARPFSFAWLAARLESFTLPRSDGVVCISTYTREGLGSLARKTWVVPNAVDGSFFKINRQPVPPPRLLCVGHVQPRKNQNALIRVLDALQARHGFELIFLGGAGRQDDYGREFFELIAARPWCRYEGFADRETLKEYLATACGLVLPSLEENCPMAILEAMAAGVPVAAACVGGVPDLVRPRETGLLFNPLRGEEMAASVEALLMNPTEKMVAQARDEARRRFYPEIIAQKHVEIYREVLKSRPGFR